MPRQYFDKLDLTILNALCENARTPYLEIAREYGVSGAAVHQRVQRLIASKVITGSHCDIDPSTIGYHVVAFVGICAKPGTDIRELVQQLEQIEEITECNIVKMHARTNLDILRLVTLRMRAMPISNTETMVSFSEGFKRPLPIRNDK